MIKTVNNCRSVLLSFLLIALSSCVSSKKIIYFQNDSIDQTKISNSYKTVFKPDDLLKINVSALDLDAVKPFNLPTVNYTITTNSAVGNPQQQTYLIDNKGFIYFPVIGKIKLGGLTRQEAIQLIKSKLSPDYIKNPTINIGIVNFTITVLGDVKKPGNYTIPNERITILQALGLAGDTKISAKRNNILVQREIGDKKVQYRLDLLSNNIFSSPAYYLQQNDVVYVEPNNAILQDASYNKNTGLFISLASIIVSLIAILAR